MQIKIIAECTYINAEYTLYVYTCMHGLLMTYRSPCSLLSGADQVTPVLVVSRTVADREHFKLEHG